MFPRWSDKEDWSTTAPEKVPIGFVEMQQPEVQAAIASYGALAPQDMCAEAVCSTSPLRVVYCGPTI